MGASVCTDLHHLLRDLHIPATPFVESDPYSSDDFRMYEFKIRRCTRSRSHDWTECPFAHQGEKARRRDPRKHPYSASVCPDFRRSGGSSCPHGDACGFAHGVFEAWLHPSRYRTEPCKDGPRCHRKVCFFAHTLTQLRPVSQGQNGNFTKHHCFMHSPRSTLSAAAFSSPPSPASDLSYEAALLRELVGLLRAASFKDGGGSWADVYGGQDPFIVSPLTPRSINLRGSVEIGERINVNSANGWADRPDPDLGWVDDLLM